MLLCSKKKANQALENWTVSKIFDIHIYIYIYIILLSW